MRRAAPRVSVDERGQKRTRLTRVARHLHRVRNYGIPRSRCRDGDNHRFLAIDPLHIAAQIPHNHDFQDSILAQELGRA